MGKKKDKNLLLCIIVFCIAGIMGIYKMLQTVKKTDEEEISAKEKLSERSGTYYKLTYEWLQKKLQGESILAYFEENNIKKIAIYGKGSLGELLFQELRDSGIEIVCFIDQCSLEMFQTEDAVSGSQYK